MRFVLAHGRDEPARALVRRWGSLACLVTPADLHRSRYNLNIDRRGVARASVNHEGSGAVVPEAVVTRLGGVTGAELARIRPEDREYAAAEVTAFLLAWLDACLCPVLNPPVAGSLNGPPWYPEQWAMAASRAGLTVRRVQRCAALGQSDHEPWGARPPVPAAETGPAVAVTVVGDRWFGRVHPLVGQRLCAVARDAGTPLLGATVDGQGDGATVSGLTAWPDVGRPEVADAIALTLASA
jgi:hypothetical protein